MSGERPGEDLVEANFGLDGIDGILTPGGKVDPRAIRRASELDVDDEGLRRVVFTLQRDLQTRLDKYLTSRITFMSRTQLQRLIVEGGVEVNDQPTKRSAVLRKGDRISVVVPPPPSKGLQAEEIPLDVLYEDDDLIVLNKQPDIIVHPARSHQTGTLLNALLWHFQEQSGGTLSNVGEEFARPGVVHRLDRNTTGCIVFAKCDEAHWKLGRQFEHRTVDKRYLALVQGSVEPDVQQIDFPIGPHPSRRKGYREKWVVRFDDTGKSALTICRVRERYRLQDRSVGDQFFTLVELELKTGRTHQIRVHLSHLGWPIIGDDMYGGRVFEADGDVLMDRQALHAATLSFSHPIEERPLSFQSPLKNDMADLMGYLRRAGEVEQVTPSGASINLAGE